MWLLIVTSVASIVVVSRATTWQQTPELVCPCEGMNAHLPWRYTLETGESFNLVRWYQGKPVGLQIATYQFSSNTFTPNAPYDAPGKLAFDNMLRNHSVAITMNNVMLNDSSQYSVTLQPVGDNTNGFLRVQMGDIQCCALRDNMGEICGRRLDLAGGYNYTLKWNYTEAMEATDQEMDITVYYDGSSIVSCTGVPDCTIQSFEVPKGIEVMELNASLSLRVNGSSTCHTSHEPYVIKIPAETTTAETTTAQTTTTDMTTTDITTTDMTTSVDNCTLAECRSDGTSPSEALVTVIVATVQPESRWKDIYILPVVISVCIVIGFGVTVATVCNKVRATNGIQSKELLSEPPMEKEDSYTEYTPGNPIYRDPWYSGDAVVHPEVSMDTHTVPTAGAFGGFLGNAGYSTDGGYYGNSSQRGSHIAVAYSPGNYDNYNMYGM